MADNKNKAEEILRKSESEMSEVERMMSEIIEKNRSAGEKTEAQNPGGNKTVRASSAAPVPPENRARPKPVPPAVLEEEVSNEEIPELEPISFDLNKVQNAETGTKLFAGRQTNTEREKKIAAAVKKRGRQKKPTAVIIILLCLIGISAAVFNMMIRDIYRNSNPMNIIDNPTQSDNADTDGTFPTPEPGDVDNSFGASNDKIVILSGTTPSPEVSPAETVKPGKTFVMENLSWEQAASKCKEMGGHMVTISDADELKEVTDLADQNECEKVWIGCHRVNGEFVWENNEKIDIDSLNSWGKGEPSGYDFGDKVAEDYVLLWKFKGSWYLNDSRNDPVKDYPEMYSGQIGFISEADG